MAERAGARPSMRPAFVWNPVPAPTGAVGDDECIESATLRAVHGEPSVVPPALPIVVPAVIDQDVSEDDVDQAFLSMFSEEPAPASVVVAETRPQPPSRPVSSTPLPSVIVQPLPPIADLLLEPAPPAPAPRSSAPPVAHTPGPRRTTVQRALYPVLLLGAVAGAVAAWVLSPVGAVPKAPAANALTLAPAPSPSDAPTAQPAPLALGDIAEAALASEPVPERSAPRADEPAPVSAAPRALAAKRQRERVVIERAPYRSIPIKPGEQMASFPLE